MEPMGAWSSVEIQLLDFKLYYTDVIMTDVASQITSLTAVYAAVYSGADQRKHQSSVSLAFVRAIQQWPVNSSHKGPVTRKMFPFEDIIMGAHMIVVTAVPDLVTFHIRGKNFYIRAAAVEISCSFEEARFDDANYASVLNFTSTWKLQICRNFGISRYLGVRCVNEYSPRWWKVSGIIDEYNL